MKKILLLMLLALMALPSLAQTPPPSRLRIRDPFAKPSAATLSSMQVPAGPVALETTPTTTGPVTEGPVQTESHAVMIEQDAPTQGDAALWVLGGLACLVVIGALAYVVLGANTRDELAIE